jgi:hypothetical protein
MRNETGDEVADYLLKTLVAAKAIFPRHLSAEATRWELIIRTHAQPLEEPLVVNFATKAAPSSSEATKPENT